MLLVFRIVLDEKLFWVYLLTDYVFAQNGCSSCLLYFLKVYIKSKELKCYFPIFYSYKWNFYYFGNTFKRAYTIFEFIFPKYSVNASGMFI